MMKTSYLSNRHSMLFWWCGVYLAPHPPLGGVEGCLNCLDAAPGRVHPGDADDGGQWVAVDPELARQATAILEQELVTVESTLDSLPGLILSVRRNLRRHLNDEHIARARAFSPAGGALVTF